MATSTQFGKLWSNATEVAFNHAELLIANNPAKTPKELLLRPDMAEAITYPLDIAYATTTTAATSEWPADIYKTDINKVLATLKRNRRYAELETKRILRTSKTPEQREKRATLLADEMARRADFAVEYAKKMSDTLTLMKNAPKGAGKTWFSENPQCSACIALNGTTIPVAKTFDETAGGRKLKPFTKLYGPPRHPRCGCKLVLA